MSGRSSTLGDQARKVTYSTKRTAVRALFATGRTEPTILWRPERRADCLEGGANAERPCPFVGCRYHLAIDVAPNGSLTINFPDLELDELLDTCALDVAEFGGLVLDDVGRRMNLTRERARQIEILAGGKVRRRLEVLR